MQGTQILPKAWSELTLACSEVVQNKSSTQALRRAHTASAVLTSAIADLQARLEAARQQLEVQVAQQAAEAQQRAQAQAAQRQQRAVARLSTD